MRFDTKNTSKFYVAKGKELFSEENKYTAMFLKRHGMNLKSFNIPDYVTISNNDVVISLTPPKTTSTGVIEQPVCFILK